MNLGPFQTFDNWTVHVFAVEIYLLHKKSFGTSKIIHLKKKIYVRLSA